MSGDLWTAWKPKTPESNKSVLAITPRRSAMWGSSPVARTSPASRQRDRCNAVMGRKAGDIFLSKVLFDIKPDNKLLYKVFPVMRRQQLQDGKQLLRLNLKFHH